MSEENTKPLFLQKSATQEPPAEVTWVPTQESDFTKPLNARAKEACRLAAAGLPQKEIATKLGYTQAWTSTLLGSVRGQAEIARLQNKVFEKTVQDRVQILGTPAMDVVEDILTTEDPNIKPALKLDAAKWVAEKISGKAIQSVEVGGSVVLQVLDQIKALRDSGQIIDVIPSERREIDGQVTEVREEKSESQQKLDAFLDSDL